MPSTDDLLFDIPALIAGASQTMPLLPGDLLLTGSPAGNGQHWKRFLRDGDVMTGSIDGPRHPGRARRRGRRDERVPRHRTARRPSTPPTSTAPTPRPRSPRAPRRSATGAAGARTTCSARSTSSTTPSAWPPRRLVPRGPSRLALAVVRHERPAEGLAPPHQPGAHDDRHRRDAERGNQGFPHGIGGADDVIAMPLQCSTQWDGLGHIFDHGMAWNGRRRGRRRHERGRPRHGHRARGIRHRLAAACCSTSAGTSQPDDRASCPTATPSRPPTSRRAIAAQGARAPSAAATSCSCAPGQLARARRDGWGDYAGGPRPGLSLTTAGWLHRTEIAAIATDTWGFEVRPNEFDAPAFQPLHQVVIPNLGLTIGEMWDLEALGADCAAAGRYDFLLVRRAAADHRRGRLAHQPRRDPVDPAPEPQTEQEVLT